MSRCRIALVLGAALTGGIACDGGLAQALGDVRAAAPIACKDFCVQKVTCEWSSDITGSEEEAAFSDAVHSCTVSCAWYAEHGAFVVEQDAGATAKEYVGRVQGDVVSDLLACVLDLDVMACVVQEEGGDVYRIDADTEDECFQVDSCWRAVGVRREFDWMVIEGAEQCLSHGDQALDVPYF